MTPAPSPSDTCTSQRAFRFDAFEAHSATSGLSEVEVASALVRRCREGDFSIRDRDRALAALRNDLLSVHVVELNPQITEVATDLLLSHKLRVGDAIQLASALVLFRMLGSSGEFVAYDERLPEAARAEGLALRG